MNRSRKALCSLLPAWPELGYDSVNTYRFIKAPGGWVAWALYHRGMRFLPGRAHNMIGLLLLAKAKQQRSYVPREKSHLA